MEIIIFIYKALFEIQVTKCLTKAAQLNRNVIKASGFKRKQTIWCIKTNAV